MTLDLPMLAMLFFGVALVYSSVGFGGGSSYLALLALTGLPYTQIPTIGLLCNLMVVAGGLHFALRGGYFNFWRCLPFVLTSIPAAFISASYPISQNFFMGLLAFSLICAGLRVIFISKNPRPVADWSTRKNWLLGLSLGLALGGLSGLVGIGGGIFLAPVLLMLRWGNPREVAAMSTFFIAVNSCSGLLGQMQKGVSLPEPSWILALGLAVFLGGQIGSRLAFRHWSFPRLMRLSAALTLLVGLRILGGVG